MKITSTALFAKIAISSSALLLVLVLLVASSVSSVAHAQQYQQIASSSAEDASSSNNNRALTARALPSQELQSLPVSRLRRFLGDRGANCDGCVDKRDLVERAVEVMTWPTRDDAVATELSLEQDLMGPLANDVAIPIGDDRSVFQDQIADETFKSSPSARSSLTPLSDEEVANLLELYRMRMLIAEKVARCGPKHENGTQYCAPYHAIVTRETE